MYKNLLIPRDRILELFNEYIGDNIPYPV